MSTDVIKDFEYWLNQYLNFEKTPVKNIFWLTTMEFLCKKLNNPQLFNTTIHVAGSKGKGSVSKMIASILKEAKYKVGVYSSPHITDFRERICTPDRFLDDKIYEQSGKELKKLVNSLNIKDLPGERPITWFELVTVFAFLCFRNAKMDYSIYEVGLGGRLDSTNVIKPKFCCITPIELEHVEFLGDTLEKIAYEKAGIIKENTPVFIGKQQNKSVEDVFINVAKQKSSQIYFIKDFIQALDYDFNKKSKSMSVNFSSSIFTRPLKFNLKLLGQMQVDNAVMASIAVKKLIPEITEECIEKGLEKAYLPGRFEIISDVPNYCDIPSLILDGAHTLNSINLTLQTLNNLYENEKVNLLFGCAADKDIEHIASLFKYKFNKVFLTKPGNAKISNLERIKECFNQNQIAFIGDEDFNSIIKESLEYTNKNKQILFVTGSFYLVSAIKQYLNLQ